MQLSLADASRLSRTQLRRLQTLWHRWTRKLALEKPHDRALRHYYVALFSRGRAREARELTALDAAWVIAWLEKLVRASEARQNRAAGTAGRHGFPERRRVSPTAAAWRALWVCATALGMDRERLEHFIAKRYARVGLHGLRDLRSMADLNRVLWGLKAMLRRGPGPKRATRSTIRKAA